jgi:hypothetical protein
MSGDPAASGAFQQRVDVAVEPGAGGVDAQRRGTAASA